MLSHLTHRRTAGRGLTFALTAKRLQTLALVASALFSLTLLAGGGSAPRDARSSLHGLTLRTTLPASWYGPGEEIRVYCTLTNRGKRAVSFTPPLSLTAVVITSEGKERTYPQDDNCGGPAGGEKPVVLQPGERWMTCFAVKPPRKEFLPGTYPLRVTCVFGGGDGKAVGADLKGTLVSNEVVLTIHYNVLWVN